MSNHKVSFILIFIIIFASFATVMATPSVQAEESEQDPLAEAGINVVALRNDTLDTNQDGDTDAIRVVIVVSTDKESMNLELRLIGEHKDREVMEVLQFSFSGQSNASLVYDAWASGEHELRLQIVDQDGIIISTLELPTYLLKPALKTPRIMLALNAPQNIENGEDFTISRIFAE